MNRYGPTFPRLGDLLWSRLYAALLNQLQTLASSASVILSLTHIPLSYGIFRTDEQYLESVHFGF